MALPIPEPGLVIRFNYLWKREQEEGREHPRYARPCAVVLALRQDAAGATTIIVAPITHAPPTTGVSALEIPARVKAHLGLDEERSWIVTDEVNEFVWPGFDLAPDPAGRIAYGYLPPKLYDRLRRSILENVRAGLLGRVPR